MGKKRVLVAMSGGVDSSVAAALLVEQGYECIGATMQLWSPGLPRNNTDTGCCSISAVEDARRVAARLGMPYYVLNFAEEFEKNVIDRFAEEYLQGRTPNPCIVCNHDLKFGSFLMKALELECDYIATGHYARVWYDEGSHRYCLGKAKDERKDQSYVMFGLTQRQLAHTLFPLGEFTKEKTRAVASRLGLQVAQKPESQEICFVPDNNYRNFMKDYRPESRNPGPIVDTKGTVLGTHEGLAFYTIGQRKGLGITSPDPLYVVDLDPVRNAVVVGARDEGLSRQLWAGQANWIAISELKEPLSVTTRIRSHAEPAAAVIRPAAEGRVLTEFSLPQRAITPGQAVVWYQDDVVVGGGVIERPPSTQG